MTHSSHARRQDALEARRHEVALSALIAEQKERTALVSLSGDFDMMKSEFEIGMKLEQYRRDLIEGTDETDGADAYLISTLVRARIPDCGPHDFQPGEYCADCGAYRPEGDEF